MIIFSVLILKCTLLSMLSPKAVAVAVALLLIYWDCWPFFCLPSPCSSDLWVFQSTPVFERRSCPSSPERNNKWKLARWSWCSHRAKRCPRPWSGPWGHCRCARLGRSRRRWSRPTRTWPPIGCGAAKSRRRWSKSWLRSRGWRTECRSWGWTWATNRCPPCRWQGSCWCCQSSWPRQPRIWETRRRPTIAGDCCYCCWSGSRRGRS